LNQENTMATKLEKTLKREIAVKDTAYIVAISPEGMILTVKGRRKGLQLLWADLVAGEAALAVALQASVGLFTQPTSAAESSEIKKRVRKKKRKPAP
jgi:hypothetical protein